MATDKLRAALLNLPDDLRPVVTLVQERLQAMRTVELLPSEAKQAFASTTQTMVVPLAKALNMRSCAAELNRLCLGILDPVALDELQRQQAQAQTVAEAEVMPLLKEVLPQPEVTIELEQLEGKGSWSVVCLCPDVNSCYQNMSVLHTTWQQVNDSFYDAINTPTSTGQQELRTSLLLPNGHQVTCHLRTPDMQEYATEGMAGRCFNPELFCLADYLAWVPNARLIAEQTAGNDGLFLKQLQSQVFAEQILVAVEGQPAVWLPATATALDAALMACGATALSTKNLTINGNDVTLDAPVKAGATLAVTLSETRTVDKRWLPAVRTVYSATMISTALGDQTAGGNQVDLGRRLLEEALTPNQLFNLETNLLEGGNYVEQLKESYRAIVTGDCDARDVAATLFPVSPHGAGFRWGKLKRRQYSVPVLLLTVLWCLDPIWATWLLHEPFNITPVNFTIVRLMGLLGFCSALLVISKRHQNRPGLYKLFQDGRLWFASLTFVITILTTYLTLKGLWPQEYIAIVLASTLLVPLFHNLQRTTISLGHRALAGMAALSTVFLLPWLRPEITWATAGTGLILLGSFTALTINIDALKRNHERAINVPAFLFGLSTIALSMSLPWLLPLVDLTDFGWHWLPHFIYSLTIGSFPYWLYVKLLTSKGAQMLATSYTFGTVLTIWAQWLAFNRLSGLTLLPLLLVCSLWWYLDRRYLYPEAD